MVGRRERWLQCPGVVTVQLPLERESCPNPKRSRLSNRASSARSLAAASRSLQTDSNDFAMPPPAMPVRRQRQSSARLQADARSKRRNAKRATNPFGLVAQITWQRPTLPQSHPCSTIGPGGLYFRVRDGNGCGPSGITARNQKNRSANCVFACSLRATQLWVLSFERINYSDHHPASRDSLGVDKREASNR